MPAPLASRLCLVGKLNRFSIISLFIPPNVRSTAWSRNYLNPREGLEIPH